MNSIPVSFHYKIHYHLFGIPVDKLGTNSHLAAGRNIFRGQVFYQLLRISEKERENVFPGLAQSNGSKFWIGEKEGSIRKRN